jgi:hypothetical protein
MFTLGQLTTGHVSTPFPILLHAYDGSPSLESSIGPREPGRGTGSDTDGCSRSAARLTAQMGDCAVIAVVHASAVSGGVIRRLCPDRRGYRRFMRALSRKTSRSMIRPPRAALPLFGFTPPGQPWEREGYAVAESIMRSSGRAKQGQRAQPPRNRVLPVGAAR